MRIPVILCLACLPVSLYAQANSGAADAVITRTMQQGHAALENHDYVRAEAYFADGLARARAQGDVSRESVLAFNLGMTLQARGRAEDAPELLVRAETYYRDVLRLKPASSAAYNNLAGLYLEMGRVEEAAAAYEQAVDLGDERQAFYALNYGDLLAETGDPERALGYYQIAERQQPRNPQVWERLVRFYLTHDRDRLAAYLWQRLHEGQERTATDVALRALADAEWDADPKAVRLQEELLALAVMGLSEQYYDPATFDDTPAGVAFRRLEANPVVGEGAREMRLMQTEDPGKLHPDDLRWWVDRGQPFRDAPRGVWPREACQALLRSLGDWYRGHSDPDRAAVYYRLSADFYGESDPEAVLRLVDLYLGNDKGAAATSERIEALLNRYAFDLFEGKGEAYRQSHLKKIFAYHRTLGTIYALLERWGSPQEVTSALFQLENARRVAKQHREAYPDAEPLRFDERLVSFLARGYDATGYPERALRVRLEGALELYQRGDRDGARRLIQGIEEAGGLPADAAERDVRLYEGLRRRLQ